MSAISKAFILGTCATGVLAEDKKPAKCEAAAKFADCTATGDVKVTSASVEIKADEKDAKKLTWAGKLELDVSAPKKLFTEAGDAAQKDENNGDGIKAAALNEKVIEVSGIKDKDEVKDKAICVDGAIKFDIEEFYAPAKDQNTPGEKQKITVTCGAPGGDCLMYSLIAAAAVVIIGGAAAYFILANKGGDDAGDDEDEEDGEGEEE